MPNQSKIDRRDFLKQTAAASTAIGARVGLNDRENALPGSDDRSDNRNGRIMLGFIGTGARAQDVMDDVLKLPGFEVVAVCDAYEGRLERAVERTAGRAKIYKDHRE